MLNNPILEAKNLSFSINQNKLFHGLSFELLCGEALHIKGGNGSGKTTLLKILLGITSPRKGHIKWVDDTNTVYLGHKNVLKDYLSVEDNLYLHGIDLANTSTKSILKELNLLNKIDILVGNLSYGQKKKLALVRVLLNQSKVIVLDEPCVGLDDRTRAYIVDFLNSELSKNKSVIYTSHIPIEIKSKKINIDKE